MIGEKRKAAFGHFLIDSSGPLGKLYKIHTNGLLFIFCLKFIDAIIGNMKKRLIIIISIGFVAIAAVFVLLFLPTFKNIPNPQVQIKKVKSQSEIDSLPQNIKDFGIKIDKIQILVPVIKDVDGANKTVYNEALKGGVAHFKGTSLPSVGSNIFIFGHSSSLEQNDYSTVFVRLDELAINDEIIVYFQNKKYTYKVFDKKIVEKNDLSVLNPTPKEQLTLMTCWPIGTDEQRLIIMASKQ